MMEPWNNKAILPPPMNTFIYKNEKDIRDLRLNINNIITVLSKQSPLHQESAVFSRFLYKFDRKFRNDIGYRNFKKVNTALRKYLALNLLKDVERFESILPNQDDEELFLPTKQMLQYLLVRIMSFAKLMLRIVICAKQAAVFYLDRIKRGQSHWMCLMPYALLSRIWSMTQVLLQHSCNWYNQLHPILGLLQLKGLEYLPSGYALPANLEIWCDLKNLHEHSHFMWTNKEKIKIEPTTIEHSNSILCDSLFEYVNQINQNIESMDETDSKILSVQKLTNSDININSKDDVGVPILGENLKNSKENMLSTQKCKKIVSNKQLNCIDIGVAVQREKITKEIAYTHSIDNVSNNYCLKEFLSLEEEYRNKKVDKTLTAHLSLMQWHSLKSSLLKLTEDCCLPRKLQKKIKKIWNDKCLYYK